MRIDRKIGVLLLVLLISILACGPCDLLQDSIEGLFPAEEATQEDTTASDQDVEATEEPAPPADSIEAAIPDGITKVETDDPAGDNGGAADHAYFMIGYDSNSVYMAIRLHTPASLDGTRVHSDREPTSFGYQFKIHATSGGGYEVRISTDEGNPGYYSNGLGFAQVLGYGDDFIAFSFSREILPTLLEHNYWLVSGLGDAMDTTPGQGSRGPWLSFSGN
jgi:hypothetical protein